MSVNWQCLPLFSLTSRLSASSGRARRPASFPPEQAAFRYNSSVQTQRATSGTGSVAPSFPVQTYRKEH